MKSRIALTMIIAIATLLVMGLLTACNAEPTETPVEITIPPPPPSTEVPPPADTPTMTEPINPEASPIVQPPIIETESLTGTEAALITATLPVTPTPTLDPIAQMIVQGLNYYESGDLVKAAEQFSQVLQMNPNFTDAYFHRARLYLDQDKYDAAIQDLDKLISLDPKVADAYNVRGVAYLNKGSYDKAMQDLNKAIELDPTLVRALINRGTLYGILENYDRAVVDLTAAVQAAPNDPNAYFNRALAYEGRQEYGNAINDYKKSLELTVDKDIQKEIVDHLKALGANVDLPTAQPTTQPSGTPTP